MISGPRSPGTCVGRNVLADRAEDEVSKATVAACADDEQVGFRGLVDEHLCRIALLDMWLDEHRGILAKFLSDHLDQVLGGALTGVGHVSFRDADAAGRWRQRVLPRRLSRTNRPRDQQLQQ